MRTVDDRPGLCQHVVDSLSESQKLDPANYSNCVLMFDEMAIKHHTTWVPSEGRHVGYVDIGGIIEQDQDKIAKNALVLMAVGFRKKWKSPISFHLTAGLTSDTLSVLITQAIDALSKVNIQVRVLVSDGHRTNISALKKLGCNIDELNFSFMHNGVLIQAMLDQVHMVKVMRNLFHDIEVIIGAHGTARWQDIKNLVALQVNRKKYCNISYLY